MNSPTGASWWSTARIFAGPDAINETIWSDSPRIHARLGFTPTDLANPGSLGAQQAMLDPAITAALGTAAPVLPWVPDLLGEEWTHESGIVIVGQNYGQFISGYTNRPKRMSALDYAKAKTWQDFQQVFIREVVINDDDYYELLAPLLDTTTAKDRFVVTDLIRCTLVKRGTPKVRGGTLQRLDANIDLNDEEHCKVYGRHADLPESTGWFWDRLVATKASMIVALGRAPCCGLLRLFASKACAVTAYPSGKVWTHQGVRWMYNCGINSIQGRLKGGEWHVVNSAALQRSWHIVLVAHPATENNQYASAGASSTQHAPPRGAKGPHSPGPPTVT